MSEQKAAPANSIDGINAAIAGYREQYGQAEQQLNILDQNYARQRDQFVSALRALSGAIAALDQLVKNVEAEEATKTTVVEATSEPLPVSENTTGAETDNVTNT